MPYAGSRCPFERGEDDWMTRRRRIYGAATQLLLERRRVVWCGRVGQASTSSPCIMPSRRCRLTAVAGSPTPRSCLVPGACCSCSCRQLVWHGQRNSRVGRVAGRKHPGLVSMGQCCLFGNDPGLVGPAKPYRSGLGHLCTSLTCHLKLSSLFNATSSILDYKSFQQFWWFGVFQIW